jgi:hypothetical protein
MLDGKTVVLCAFLRIAQTASCSLETFFGRLRFRGFVRVKFYETFLAMGFFFRAALADLVAAT